MAAWTLDDRAGVATLLRLLQVVAVEGIRPAAPMVVAFTVQEEVGLRGAQVAAQLVPRAEALLARGDHLVVRGSGVNGYLLVEEDSLEIEVKLGFALKLMEAPIRSAIENAIEEELAAYPMDRRR